HDAKLGPFEWSPDGARIAFSAGVDRHDPLEGRVYVTSADGEALANLTPNYPGHVHDVAWRDAGSLGDRASRGVWSELALLGAAGDRDARGRRRHAAAPDRALRMEPRRRFPPVDLLEPRPAEPRPRRAGADPLPRARRPRARRAPDPAARGAARAALSARDR